MVDARMVFESMPRRDVVLWTSLIQGFVDNGESKLALVFFEDMKLSGCCPNSQTCVAALAACASSAMREEAVDVDGKLEARKVFDGMAGRCKWRQQAGLGGVFGMARENDPDERTFVAALMACIHLSASEPPVPREDGKLVRIQSLEKGMEIHSLAAKFGRCEHRFVGSSLVDMYAKCGDMVKARAVFKRMPSRDVVAELYRRGLEDDQVVGSKLLQEVRSYECEHLFGSLAVRDIVAWNALITGFGQQGDTSRMFEACREMREDGVRANAITFVSVITACSHGGLVERGREFFQAMDPDSGIVCGIHHYSSLVDLVTESPREHAFESGCCGLEERPRGLL
ncbi:pentatricopeptide repeat-containing protein DOT4, chloroplastic-like [Selaginella moellendorffii]|uniref:pentatricopeptide repeat-containing protein DOT4, chloroplastic-like n=1 Tax=Selaginella moellendorffii TaxID=88036 RepID=UPI000D1C69C0|nr:pentatricopeptide repeat-containing protein DOT4, chloroplastic-like [Selaginella moellendorffii]|eukprot:XP_024542064.1 pentatricopeptide repeat-containing protein DOT4, chloroplastic-like [Selaginella moellendorffii]